jgi:hypothetical protein
MAELSIFPIHTPHARILGHRNSQAGNTRAPGCEDEELNALARGHSATLFIGQQARSDSAGRSEKDIS